MAVGAFLPHLLAGTAGEGAALPALGAAEALLKQLLEQTAYPPRIVTADGVGVADAAGPPAPESTCCPPGPAADAPLT